MAAKKHEAYEILEDYRKIIWPLIDNALDDPLFPEKFRIPKKYQNYTNIHSHAVREYPRRKGKYLRPALLMLTAEAMGASRKKILPTATAMQLSEDFLLVHDDIMDGSTKRRGKKTLHRIYGVNVSINAGDHLQSAIWQLLSKNYKLLGREKSEAIYEEMYKILVRTYMGQSVEAIWTENNRKTISDEDYFFIVDGKTSYYTIAGPMRLGAIIAGASQDELQAITEFGVYLGRCFQLVDDILDLTGDFGGKKEMANDIYEGKRTLILGHLARNLNKSDFEKLSVILGKKREQKTKEEVGWVLDMMNKHGSIDYARSAARHLKDKSNRLFEARLGFLKKEPQRSSIKLLIDFILNRDH